MSSRVVLSAVLGAVLLQLGCASTSSLPVPDLSSLRGTEWQLLSIQSMDDAQGTLRVSDPSRFLMRLEADGRALLRLDCNRAFGQWRSEPDRAESGSFQFSQMGSTKALCPPPHLDERIARDLSFVRGFRRIDGHLYLSLMADAAIYEWAPVAEARQP